VARFADALEQNPAPTKLGDVALRFEPSMLIAETPKPPSTWWPTLAWLAGVGFLLATVGSVLLSSELVAGVALAVVGGGSLAAATILSRREVRQRRFVANFGTNTLRLDFTTPIAGQPRTMLVPFDDVRAVELMEQADGRACLVVDFEADRRLLREVLAAHITPAEEEASERLLRVLRGAFGLGEPPADSPAFAPNSDESTFEPG